MRREAWKAVRPDGTTRNGFSWEVGVGGTVRSDHALYPGNATACPWREGDGLCLAKTWAGAALAGFPTLRCLVVEFDDNDVVGEDADKIRVRGFVTVRAVFDAQALVRQGWCRGANLHGANLYGADLRGANLDGANLDGANLYGANLDGANLYGANLDGANLDGANLYGADLDGADLDGANLYGANLRGANLRGANLYGADLDGAKLDGANLYGANLDGANLNGANLNGANLTGAIGFVDITENRKGGEI